MDKIKMIPTMSSVKMLWVAGVSLFLTLYTPSATAAYVHVAASAAAQKGVRITTVIEQFDAAAEQGHIAGAGETPVAAKAKVRAFRNFITTAGTLIEIGDRTGACQQLREAYNKSDGQTTNKDFINGPAKPKVNQMIREVMSNLGCS